jgi:dipeptidyl aminopeptidase/acylaminoacyl peptidase
MSRSLLLSVALVVLGLALAGCGGSGGGPEGTPPVSGETVSVGPLQVEVDSAAAFKTTMLTSPGTSRIAFAALHGTRIVRLEQMGYARIAFTSDREGNKDIYVMNADGSGQTQLTKYFLTDERPTWSPDGSKIAFSSKRDGYPAIYAMSADGSGQTRVCPRSAHDLEPAWSPDGQKIAYTHGVLGRIEIYVMAADGRWHTGLTNNSAIDYRPAWSPDGRKIAFVSDRNLDFDIYVMNADGSGQANLTSESSLDAEPAWSPDGRRIAFSSSRGGTGDIYVMDADGSGQSRLTTNSAWDVEPAWSPDGRKIAFASRRDGNYEIYAMNADGSDETNLSGHGADDLNPAWCPAPSVMRSLIGASGSDGGSDPPFAEERPLVIVGLNDDGLVSATTIGLNTSNLPSLQVAALQNIGTDLAGAKITGTNIRRIVEDMGRGLPNRVWPVSGTPTTGSVLVFFSGRTGKVSSVIASSDTALADAGAAVTGSRVVVRGSFTEVYSARDPERNLVSGPANQVALDSHTGEVTAVN